LDLATYEDAAQVKVLPPRQPLLWQVLAATQVVGLPVSMARLNFCGGVPMDMGMAGLIQGEETLADR